MVISLILIILTISIIQTIKSGNNFLTGIGEIPDSQSSYVKSVIDKEFKGQISYDLIIVLNKELSSTDKNKVSQILKTNNNIQSIDSSENNPLLASLITDKQTNILIVNLKKSDFRSYENFVPIIREKIKKEIPDSYNKIFVTGNSAFSFDMNYLSEIQGKQAEISIFIITLLVLFFAFSSIPGAFIAVSSGFIATIITIAILKFISGYYELSIFCQNVSTMLGLGLSIDYSLLIISRYKKEIENNSPEQALIKTLNSAGKSVIYSGLTVMIGFTVLFIPGLNLAYSIALGGSLVSLMAILTALTYTPLALNFSRKFLSFPFKELKKEKKLSEKWGNFISNNSLKLTLLSLAFLLITAIPVFNLKLAEPDIKSMPDNMESKKGFVQLDKVSESDLFYPFQIVIESKNKAIHDQEIELYNLAVNLKKYPFEKIYTIFGEIKSTDYTNYYLLKNTVYGSEIFSELEKYLLSKSKKQTMIIAFPQKILKAIN